MAEENKSNIGLKIALGILIALLISAGAVMFKMNSDAEKTENQLMTEKEKVMNDLDVMIENNKKLNISNDSLQLSLNEELEKLIAARDSLSDSEATVSSLLHFKSRYLQLKKKYNDLLVEYEVLKDENKNLQTTVAMKETELANQVAVNDSLAIENVTQANTITAAKELSIASLNGIGIIERSSGKQIPTDKARRVDKVKLCFAVAANKVADKGDRVYHIQILDPKNNVIGAKETIDINGMSLTYSAETKFFYKNKTLDICEYITEDKFEKGTYFVNIFQDGVNIANSTFDLK